MGSETKVGLLVGMCFIVCFAIILAHRGTPDEPQATPAFQVTTAQAEAAANERPAEHNDEARKPTARPADTRRSMTPTAAQRTQPRSYAERPNSPAPTGADDPQRFTRRTIPIPAPPTDDQLARSAPVRSRPNSEDAAINGVALESPARFAPTASQPLDQPWYEAGRDAIDRLASAGYQLASRVQAEQAQQPVEPARHESHTEAPPEIEAPGPETRTADAPVPPAARTPRVRERYTVQPGDTLTRIARAKYGNAGKATVDAIFAANQDRMSSPDRLLVGKEINLPELDLPATERSTAQAEPSEPTATQLVDARTPAPDRQTAKANQELREFLAQENDASGQDYVIQPGDTLSRIVQQQYGTADRAVVQQVYAANRKHMPDPDRVIVGRILTLPVIAGLEPAGGALAHDADEPVVAKAEVTTSEPKTDEGAAKFRWYELKKGDLLSTVAQTELGSARRWPEVAKLNQDIIPDPSRVTSGTRIRLPLEGAQTADASTRRGGGR